MSSKYGDDPRLTYMTVEISKETDPLLLMQLLLDTHERSKRELETQSAACLYAKETRH